MGLSFLFSIPPASYGPNPASASLQAGPGEDPQGSGPQGTEKGAAWVSKEQGGRITNLERGALRGKKEGGFPSERTRKGATPHRRKPYDV